jgi:hypothetical protein
LFFLTGAGGGLSASATADQPQNITNGTDIAIAGLSFQVFSLTLFFVLTMDYAWRVYKRQDLITPVHAKLRSSLKFHGFLFGLALSFTCVFVRCGYRVAELSSGWGSEIMSHEIEFIVMEGIMIVIATISLNVFHPGFCFGEQFNQEAEKGTMSHVSGKSERSRKSRHSSSALKSESDGSIAEQV